MVIWGGFGVVDGATPPPPPPPCPAISQWATKQNLLQLICAAWLIVRVLGGGFARIM